MIKWDDVEAKRLQYEKDYVYQTCHNLLNIEYRNSDGTRTDCYSIYESIEYDFADKWAECIGQSLHYSRLNNNFPSCVLIIESVKDCKFVERAKGLGVRVQYLDYVGHCGEPIMGLKL